MLAIYIEPSVFEVALMMFLSGLQQHLLGVRKRDS